MSCNFNGRRTTKRFWDRPVRTVASTFGTCRASAWNRPPRMLKTVLPSCWYNFVVVCLRSFFSLSLSLCLCLCLSFSPNRFFLSYHTTHSSSMVDTRANSKTLRGTRMTRGWLPALLKTTLFKFGKWYLSLSRTRL